MLTPIEVWSHLNSRHTQNFTSCRPTKSHYSVEKHTEIPDIIYTQMTFDRGSSPGMGNILFTLAGGDVQRENVRPGSGEMSGGGNVLHPTGQSRLYLLGGLGYSKRNGAPSLENVYHSSFTGNIYRVYYNIYCTVHVRDDSYKKLTYLTTRAYRQKVWNVQLIMATDNRQRFS